MIRDEELQEWHDILKAKQDALEPYLTLSQMCAVLGFDNNGRMRHVIKKMVAKGLAQEFNFGEYQKRYRFL